MVDDEAKHESLMGDIIMAAGLSQKQITSRIYNRLKWLEYQLSKAGVNTRYCKGTASKRGHLVFYEEGAPVSNNECPRWVGDGGFNIKYSSGNMSNGETFITGRIYTVLHGVNRIFGWTEKDGSFEQGLEFIKQNFSTGDRTV
jgi:hypothetical protein